MPCLGIHALLRDSCHAHSTSPPTLKLVHPCALSENKILVQCNSLQSEAAAQDMLKYLTLSRLSIVGAAGWCRLLAGADTLDLIRSSSHLSGWELLLTSKPACKH